MSLFFDLFSYNKTLLSGAMDMIVIKQPDDTYKISPMLVRFGQFRILKAKEKNVQVYINDKKTDLLMRLSEQGEAYVLREVKKRKKHQDEQINNLNDSLSISNSSDGGYASPLDVGISAPSSPKREEDKQESIKFDKNKVFSKLIHKRKMSFDLLVHKETKKKNKIIKENAFCIERTYDKVINETNMKIELSNSWNNISKYKDNSNFNIKEQFQKSLFDKNEFYKDPWKVLNNANLAVKYGKHIYTWKVIAPLLISYLAFGESLPDDSLKKLTAQQNGFLMWKKINIDAFKIDISKPPQSFNDVALTIKEIDNLSPQLSPILEKKRDKFVGKDTKKLYPLYPQYKKSLRLSSKQIKQLDLKYGKNTIKFVVSSSYQGKQELSCDLYLWNYDDKIVISDVDGTITRTDVIGQLFPLLFGKDWSHKRVVKLYNKIATNGYKILYVTARAVCQHCQTKNYISSLTQDNMHMPDGPVLMSPDGLISSFKREVIDRTPQSFKIECLSQILNLFPWDSKPFYSGIGNKATDAISYESVGIDRPKIFIINEKGEVSTADTKCYKSTFEMMYDNVDELFPDVNGNNTFFYPLDYYKPKLKEVDINELFL